MKPPIPGTRFMWGVTKTTVAILVLSASPLLAGPSGSLSIGSSTVQLNGSTSITATLTDSEGNTMEGHIDVISRPNGGAGGFAYEYYSSGQTRSYTLGNGVQGVTLNAAGVYTFKLSANSGGGWVDIDTKSVTVNAAPTGSLTIDQGSVNVNGSTTIRATLSDANGDTMEGHIDVVSRPNGGSGGFAYEYYSNGQTRPYTLGNGVQGVTLDTPGTYTFRLSANDNHGSGWVTIQTASVTVAAPNQAPTGSLTIDQASVSVNGSTTLRATLNDANGDTIEGHIDVLSRPNGGAGGYAYAYYTPGQMRPYTLGNGVQGVTLDTPGTYTFQLSANDNHGSGWVTIQTASVTVTSSGTAPAIATHPSATTVNVGQTASFTVAVTGTPPFTYQWRKNGGNVGSPTSTSSTNNTFQVSNAQTSDAGSYSVVVTNGVSSATSNGAQLTVNTPPSNSPPSIVTHPADAPVNAGQTASFTVAVSGTPPFTYQWRKNGSDVGSPTNTSSTTNTFQVPNAQSSDAGSYSAYVTNGYGNATSNGGQLSVTTLQAPVATGAPAQSTTSFRASWSSVTGATKYYLDVATTNNFATGTFVTGYQNKELSTSPLYHDVINLAPSATYHYRVRAYANGVSGPNSNVVTFNPVYTIGASNASETVQAAFTAMLADNQKTTLYFPARTAPYDLSATASMVAASSRSLILMGDSQHSARINVSAGAAADAFSLGFNSRAKTLEVEHLAFEVTGYTNTLFNINYSTATDSASGTTVAVSDVTVSGTFLTTGFLLNGAHRVQISECMLDGSQAAGGSAVSATDNIRDLTVARSQINHWEYGVKVRPANAAAAAQNITLEACTMLVVKWALYCASATASAVSATTVNVIDTHVDWWGSPNGISSPGADPVNAAVYTNGASSVFVERNFMLNDTTNILPAVTNLPLVLLKNGSGFTVRSNSMWIGVPATPEPPGTYVDGYHRTSIHIYNGNNVVVESNNLMKIKLNIVGTTPTTYSIRGNIIDSVGDTPSGLISTSYNIINSGIPNWNN